MSKLIREITGINYIPRYVRMPSDMEYGSIVTHEHYNEILNLNGSQGDYNTEILRLLLTIADPDKVPHIKYLDEAVFTIQDELQSAIDNSAEALEKANQSSQDIINIINGVTKVGKSIEADKITGIDSIGANKYYGTDNSAVPGFHSLPDFVYVTDPSEGSGTTIDGIYFTPRANSIDESMFTDAVRTKLNRTGITDYDDLTGRPSINNVVLTSNKTLSELGIQPAGSYLDPSDAANIYATKTELNTLNETVTNNATSANNTFATKAALNSLSNTVENNASSANSTFARIFVGSVPSGVTPKTGDMLVTL